MDIQSLQLVSDERALAVIRAFLQLNEYDAFRPNAATLAVALLEDTGKRLAAATARITTLEAENAGLALDKLTAPPALDGITITRSEPYKGADPGWQEYNVRRVDGRLHFYAIRVVRRMNGDAEDLPDFALIEHRLLAGNPAEEF
ncbi:hypothetical protein [Burkholderia cenocepacia]|uniref:hypothetical protein n=1 Tax=Burkholderia cenocepacia TaxID=95486 RepID=UPI002231DDCC|nr:hypothetical protein [Burkholderia cenocepacia]MCW3543081.1 hypothetical protein [Burkholderia cenocepacia]